MQTVTNRLHRDTLRLYVPEIYACATTGTGQVWVAAYDDRDRRWGVREDDETRAILNYKIGPKCSSPGCNNDAIALTDDDALCCSEHCVAGQP